MPLAVKVNRETIKEFCLQHHIQKLSFFGSVLREDFCGTASASCAWVRQGEDYFATGVDFDAEVLDWGLQNRVVQLSEEQRQRVTLIEADVLEGESPPADIVAAFNFSYWIFKTRPQLLAYFKRAHSELKEDGVLFLDSFGGYEAFEECKEKTKHENFTYIWHQAKYHPVTGYMKCHIHFKFPDK